MRERGGGRKEERGGREGRTEGGKIKKQSIIMCVHACVCVCKDNPLLQV